MERRVVELSINTLIRECSKDTRDALKHFAYFSYVNREKIHDIFSYKKFNDDFINTVTCYNNGEYQIGVIRPNYNEFLQKIMIYLNIKPTSKIIDDDNLTKMMLERLEILKNVTSEMELRIEFPYIYNDLINGRRYIREIEHQRDMDKNNERVEELADKEHYYYSCGLRRSLPNFIKTQTEVYKRFIERRKDLKEKQERTSYNGYIVKNFDMDKVYMYTIHEYLKICERSNSLDEIKFYLELIDKYLKSDRNKDCYIISDENIKIDLSSILTRVENIKRRIRDNSNLVEWILIPNGKDYRKVIKEQSFKEKWTIFFSYEEFQRLEKLGNRKRTFYEGSNYIAKAIGLRKYRGYIAYIYQNGKVILDREYNEDNPKTAIDNAAYIINAEDFEELSKQEKAKLINNDKVSRKYHTDTFEQRMSKVINKEGTKEEQEAVKKLIYKLKKK